MTRMTSLALGAVLACWTGAAGAQTSATPPLGPDFSKVEVKTIALGKLLAEHPERVGPLIRRWSRGAAEYAKV